MSESLFVTATRKTMHIGCLIQETVLAREKVSNNNSQDLISFQSVSIPTSMAITTAIRNGKTLSVETTLTADQTVNDATLGSWNQPQDIPVLELAPPQPSPCQPPPRHCEEQNFCEWKFFRHLQLSNSSILVQAASPVDSHWQKSNALSDDLMDESTSAHYVADFSPTGAGLLSSDEKNLSHNGNNESKQRSRSVYHPAQIGTRSRHLRARSLTETSGHFDLDCQQCAKRPSKETSTITVTEQNTDWDRVESDFPLVREIALTILSEETWKEDEKPKESMKSSLKSRNDSTANLPYCRPQPLHFKPPIAKLPWDLQWRLAEAVAPHCAVPTLAYQRCRGDSSVNTESKKSNYLFRDDLRMESTSVPSPSCRSLDSDSSITDLLTEPFREALCHLQTTDCDDMT